MLTRLKVTGFKNLVDVDVRFGPFTCIAGANGVGKSNLFDAIRLLSALADYPLLEAAQSIRQEESHTGDIRNLFHKVGDTYAELMRFEIEMIIPGLGSDDLAQPAKASITFLQYALELAYRLDNAELGLASLEIRHESLKHINIGDAPQSLHFPNKPVWRKSAVTGRRTAAPFISTETRNGETVINLHQDGGSSGRPRPVLASSLPRTVLSSTNAAESPTALLARREMQSWRLLQLEPTALRRPDRYTDSGRLSSNGSHLPSTIERLMRRSVPGQTTDETRGQIKASIANRLAELVEKVDEIFVDRDEMRQRLTLYLRYLDGTTHPAHALSDGTLRFLALSVLEQDNDAIGVICLEEPENGIHPARIPSMLDLLQILSVDVDEKIGEDNPLRQVIINTHSPYVVQVVPDESLLVARLVDHVTDKQHYSVVQFGALPDTWRTKSDAPVIGMADLLGYLKPPEIEHTTAEHSDKTRKMAVRERPDVRQLQLPLEFADDQPY